MDLPFDDIFSEPVANLGPARGKFQPKGRFGPKRGSSSVGNSNAPLSKENKASYSQATTHLTEANPTDSFIPPVDGSGNNGCSLSENVAGSSGINNSSAARNHIVHAEDVFSTLGAVSADGYAQIDKDRSETEGEPVFAALGTSGNLQDSDVASSQEKQKIPDEIQSQGEDPGSSLFSSAADLGQEPRPLDVTVETEYPNAGSFLSDPHDDIFDYSTISFDDAGDLVSHLPNVDMSGNVSDSREPGTMDTMDAMPPVTATRVPIDQSYDGLAWSEDNSEPNVSTRMANSPLVEEFDGENNDHTNTLNTSDNNDNEAPKSSSLARKRGPRNTENSQEKGQKGDAQEKGVSDETPEQSPKKPCKKFPHSTRRGKRRVDEKLLQIPEDEIDHKKLRMRDLILLAEHRERLAQKKKTIPAKPSPNNKSSAEKTAHEGDASASASGKEGFISEQGGDPSDQVDNEESTVPLFNYHSFMEKTPRNRWSKQDTELFYAGIRQFGSDLAMIKELFPNLTRQQVKLKYKKEERQNPQRLSEALASRTKDHTYFQLVIKRLQAEQAAKESSMGFSVSASGDEAADSAIETNEEVENPRTEAAPDEEPARDSGIHENSPKPDKNNSESEEDVLDTFDTYKSEF